jgi:hypothetical protein
MVAQLTVNSVTSTTATLGITGIPAGGSAEVEISDNPRFAGIVTRQNYTTSPQTVSGLNQGGTYFARAVGKSSGGVYEEYGATVSFYNPITTTPNTATAAIMVTPAIIVPPEPIMTVVSAGALAGYPATNLLRDDPNMQLVGTSGSITFQHSGAPIDTVALLGTAYDETAAWSIHGGATQAAAEGGAPAFTLASSQFRASANLNGNRQAGFHGLARFATPQSYPWWNIRFTGGSQQGQFLSTYLVAGLARTAKNISADKVEQPLDLGGIDRVRDGTADRVYGHRMRRVDFEISLLTEMQWETQYGDLWRKIGLNEPVLVVPNSKSGAFLHDRILYGTVAQSRATNVMAPRTTHGFSVESLI